MLIQLLYFPDCPNVGVARQTLHQALAKLDEPPTVAELDVTAPGTPPSLRAWGSPTILVDGVDVAGGEASGSCCRLYPGSATRGAPSLDMVEASLRRARGRSST
jgi:hypothetical protein